MPDTDDTHEPDTDIVDAGEPNQPAETTDDTFEPERAMATIKKLRTELKTLTKEHRDAVAKLTSIEDAQLTEAEKLQRQLAEVAAERDRLAETARRSDARAAVIEAATKAGAVRPDAVAKLVNLGDIDPSAKGAADTAVRALQTEFPELFRTRPGTADAGAGKGTKPAANFNDTLRRQLGV
jgi:hypothetical protein